MVMVMVMQRLRRGLCEHLRLLGAMAMSSAEISVLPHVIRTCVISSPVSASSSSSSSSSSDASSPTADELSSTMSAYSYLQQSKRSYMNSNSSYKNHLMPSSGAAAGKPWPFRHHVDQSTTPCTTNHHYHSRFQKVFADEEKGILCYRNGMGELICEGRDEGPYYEPPSEPRASSAPYNMCSIPANGIIHRVKAACTMRRDRTQDLKTIEFMGTLFCEGRDEG